jgi:hypothetical protein
MHAMHVSISPQRAVESPKREGRRPLLSRGWVHSSVWVSLADRVDLFLRYGDLRRRSNLADLRQPASVECRFREAQRSGVVQLAL